LRADSGTFIVMRRVSGQKAQIPITGFRHGHAGLARLDALAERIGASRQRARVS
jgi:hypothetical protein